MDSPPLRLYDPADEHNKYKRARGPTRRCAAGAEEENEQEEQERALKKKYAWEHATRCLRLPAYGGSWDSHCQCNTRAHLSRSRPRPALFYFLEHKAPALCAHSLRIKTFLSSLLLLAIKRCTKTNASAHTLRRLLMFSNKCLFSAARKTPLWSCQRRGS